jgi:hypothetical protein
MKNLEEIIAIHKEYTAKSYEEKLHAGGLLWEAGQALLHLDAPDWSFTVAKALLEQAEEMAYTKEYDLAPELQSYTYLAFELARKASGAQADARLSPFIQSVLYYESFSADKTKFNELTALAQRIDAGA